MVAGASDYLVQPVDISAYTATLKRVARQRPITPTPGVTPLKDEPQTRECAAYWDPILP